MLAEDYSEARDIADDLQSRRDWVMVPDGHFLAGQVLGKEYDRSWPIDRPESEPFGAAEYDPGHGSILLAGKIAIVGLWKRLLPGRH